MNLHRRTTPHTGGGPGRRAARALAFGLVLCTGLAVAAQPVRASWTDAEWVNGPVGVRVPRDCATAGLYAAQGGGRFLDGSVLGLDLDTLAQLQGITALNSGTVSSSVPARPPVAPNTYANPLDATVISAVNAALGNGLQLGLPAGRIGAYNQWGQAPSTGQSAGAAGLVSNSGAIGLTGTPADASLPTAATIRLGALLPAVTALADARVDVGVLASSTQLDWCRTLENRVTDPAAPVVVDRDYGIASLALQTNSPVVAGARTAASAAVTTLNTTIAALGGPNGLIATTLRAQVLAAVTPVLGALGLGTVTATATVAVDLAPVNALLSQTLTDGIVTIDLANGLVRVDLARLLNGANGLNGLDPNTELLINAAVVNALVARTGALLDAWTTQVVAAAQQAVSAATVNVNLAVNLQLNVLGTITNVATVNVTLQDTLNRITTGQATLGVSAQAAAGLSGAVLAVVNPVLATILGTALTPAVRATIAAAVGTTIAPVLTTAVTTLGSSLATATAPVVTLVGAIFTPLQNALSIRVNVQPDQPGAPTTGPAVPAGRYQVDALRIGVLDGLGTAASVELARSFAGPNAEL
ncbi:choice-of-anchor G family protein [Nakamurella flavida]|uniref:Choice-of-anchor G family protein n=1 Tax=Nakamurella flavida TaxID=363630 RepID=A0A939BYT2_9ACTN|nr:choice-of-anchor G family protein [Nakamurella flavida]MBM9475018.1 choice-of-anchor G family protein [Nakamurella flavida]MDP9776587.1 hypothetical protein [Nakamurella flavida]